MADRPRSIREMQAEKVKEQDVGTLTIQNISEQLIKINLLPPEKNGKRVDFYVGSEDINLKVGQTHAFKKNRLNMAQVNRLQKMHQISVIVDSDKNKPAKKLSKTVTYKTH
jgi:hypothetical protein